MSKIVEQAHDFVPGEKAYKLATVTTANGQRVQIPAEMQNKFCTFSAEDHDVWIRFGGSGVQVDRVALSGMASEVLTEDAKTPHLHVPAGGERHVRLPKSLFTHFAHISKSATGWLSFAETTGQGEKDDG